MPEDLDRAIINDLQVRLRAVVVRVDELEEEVADLERNALIKLKAVRESTEKGFETLAEALCVIIAVIEQKEVIEDGP